MVEIGLLVRFERGDVVEVGGGIEHVVIEHDLVGLGHRFCQRVVAVRMRGAPRGVLAVLDSEGADLGAPIERRGISQRAASVGTAGSLGERVDVLTAIGRSKPFSYKGENDWKVPMPALTWPDAASTHIGASPL